MAGMGFGNFAFLYNSNRDIYHKLSYVERNIRLESGDKLGNSLRKALEIFVHDRIIQNHLEAYVPLSGELWTQITALNNTKKMQEAGYLKETETIGSKPLLPHYHRGRQVTFDGVDEQGRTQRVTDSYYYFLRIFGNAGSHAEIPGEQRIRAKMNYENLRKALCVFHEILVTAYGTGGIAPFSEDKMPIGSFLVENSREPKDQKRSKCCREFDAYTVDEDGQPEFYALLRMYRRSELDRVFLLRNRECFVEASKVSISSVPEGMTQTRELSSRDDAGEFYVISYTFNRRAQPLSRKLVHEMTPRQRRMLCAGLASCLDKLHNSETPIFHRVLNYESVYVSRFQDTWIPYIVKFDYAKIKMDAKGTVIVHAQEAKNRLQEAGLAKFVPMEWRGRDSDAGDVDWAQVDVYSLGVLMQDILMDRLGSVVQASYGEMETAGLEGPLLELLERMLAESPQARPNMHQVCGALEQEAKKWN